MLRVRMEKKITVKYSTTSVIGVLNFGILCKRYEKEKCSQF